MGALPKRKVSRGRRNRRRAHHALRPPQLIPCPDCGELKLPYRVCPNCGTYRGQQVLEIEE
ncbi:MAG: 50S ribosomal protein L32 [Chloroflexi bacterium]|nr:MAG: 50S ribosomal protein L32 [Chloroflexota bacterium]